MAGGTGQRQTGTERQTKTGSDRYKKERQLFLGVSCSVSQDRKRRRRKKERKSQHGAKAISGQELLELVFTKLTAFKSPNQRTLSLPSPPPPPPHPHPHDATFPIGSLYVPVAAAYLAHLSEDAPLRNITQRQPSAAGSWLISSFANIEETAVHPSTD